MKEKESLEYLQARRTYLEHVIGELPASDPRLEYAMEAWEWLNELIKVRERET